MRPARLLAAALVLLAAAPAAAQDGDVDLDRGPTAELYITKRPPTPEAPSLSPELQKLLTDAETKRDAKRAEAIDLLRGFLKGKPEGETRAQGLFKLAELLWEDSRRVYLEKVDDFERDLERCKTRKCKKQPVEPRIDLSEPEQLYRTLLADHPDYEHADLALYLVGFASKEDGREQEALGFFERVIEEHPDSQLYGDAWMMIGEHHFAAEQWVEARSAYSQILSRPAAATYDLALFKTAWCDWKLGEVDAAAQKLKDLLGVASKAKGGTRAKRQRTQNLVEEALDYLVIIFTEDRSITPKEIYEFLESIDDATYARDVMIKVAEAYYGQAEYERSADAYRFLISLDAQAISAATWQRKIVENWVASLDGPNARKEMKILVDTYGPESPWARHQKGQADALAKSLSATELLVRTSAQNMHAEAQQAEEREKKIDPVLFGNAAEAYATYLSGFGGGAGQSEHAVDVRYYRADILFWKLKKYEEAGDEYLAVGRSAPVGKWHKPALRQAMDAFEKARPKDTAGKRQMYPVDKKFGEAMDLYATLFKDDPEVVGLIFKYGQLFYDYGDYDEAIKRFGVIVTEYPDHPDALAAGDRILKALLQAKDWENVEAWARRLKKSKAFAAKEEQAELEQLIIKSIGKTGDTYADAGKYDQAAGHYLRVPKEFPKHKLAPQQMMNAGVMYEKAKKPEQAAGIYLDLADRYPDAEIAPGAAFSAGQLYEKVAYFDRAAEAYELLVAKFKNSRDADDALYNAGVLRQSLGQYDKAIAHYQTYAKRYKKSGADVAFLIGAVYEDSGDDGRADQAFRAFAKAHKGHRRVIEAHVRSGRASVRLGQFKRAADQLETALKMFKKASGGDKDAARPWAAEARYWQGELIYRDYEKVSLAVPPSQLDRTLKKKTDLLVKAQGVYFSVIDFEDLRWATAALFRVGNVFELFADELRNAPTPKDLSEAEAEAYRGALDMKVVEIEEVAITLYSTGYKKAIEMQVYDQYTTKIREALGRLSPDDFPPEREGRADERIGDRPLDAKLVREVAR
jgi:tetratricopeptide (TPR) repeat protein